MTRIKYGYLHWNDTDIFIQKIENISQKVTQDNVNDFSINDVLEIYNILCWMKSDKKIYQKQEVLSQLSLQYEKILEKYLGRYMNHIIDENLQNLYDEIEWEYKEDFWTLFERYKIYKKVSSGTFKKVIYKSGVSITQILEHSQIVKFYTEVLREWFLNTPDAAKILLDKYEIHPLNTKHSICLPELSEDDINEIFMNYINSPLAHINYLEIIYGVRSNAQLPISDKVKLNAARKRKELITDMERENKGVKIDHEICVSFRDCTIPLEEEQERQCQYYIYDRKWIANNKDYPTLLNNFIYLFGFADREMRIPLVSKKSEIPILMEKIIIRSQNDYLAGSTFYMKMALALLQVKGYYQELARQGVLLEDVIQWFFDEYLRDEFGISGFTIKLPSASSSYLEKCRHMLPEMESVLKQFKLYVEDGEIDHELLQMTSGTVGVSQIPSLLKNKYIYGTGSEFEHIEYLLFSDQCLLHWVSRINKNYKSFSELITHENVKKEDFSEAALDDLEWLAKNGWILYDKDGYVKIKDWYLFCIMLDLHKNEVINSYYYSPKFRRLFDLLYDKRIIKVESTLFSLPEQNWIDYLLNKSKYNNGLDIRNKYMHGTQSDSNAEGVHYQYYFYILLLLIEYMIKINDELCTFFDNNNDSK